MVHRRRVHRQLHQLSQVRRPTLLQARVRALHLVVKQGLLQAQSQILNRVVIVKLVRQVKVLLYLIHLRIQALARVL